MSVFRCTSCFLPLSSWPSWDQFSSSRVEIFAQKVSEDPQTVKINMKTEKRGEQTPPPPPPRTGNMTEGENRRLSTPTGRVKRGVPAETGHTALARQSPPRGRGMDEESEHLMMWTAAAKIQRQQQRFSCRVQIGPGQELEM